MQTIRTLFWEDILFFNSALRHRDTRSSRPPPPPLPADQQLLLSEVTFQLTNRQTFRAIDQGAWCNHTFCRSGAGCCTAALTVVFHFIAFVSSFHFHCLGRWHAKWKWWWWETCLAVDAVQQQFFSSTVQCCCWKCPQWHWWCGDGCCITTSFTFFSVVSLSFYRPSLLSSSPPPSS